MIEQAETADLPPLAAVIYPPGCAVDALMAALVAEFAAAGLRVAGVVQEAHAAAAGHCDALLLRDASDGSATGISEDRGTGASGCRLDPRGLAEVAARLEAALATRPDLLVLNRFGKAEAEGGGLRDVVSAALLRGIPVLTAVREVNAPDWHAFHQGMAVDLPPTRQAALAWVAGWRGDAHGLHAA